MMARVPAKKDLTRLLDVNFVEYCEAKAVDDDESVKSVLDRIHAPKGALGRILLGVLSDNRCFGSVEDAHDLMRDRESLKELQGIANCWRVDRRQCRMTVGEFREAFYANKLR
jgi:DNA-binding FrmR family transcriptional regulator